MKGEASSFLRCFPSPSGRKQQTAMNMGAKGSVAAPQTVKTPNRPPLRSENVVTMRNLPPKVGRVPPDDVCREPQPPPPEAPWFVSIPILHTGPHCLCGPCGFWCHQALKSNISKAYKFPAPPKTKEEEF